MSRADRCDRIIRLIETVLRRIPTAPPAPSGSDADRHPAPEGRSTAAEADTSERVAVHLDS